MNSKLTAINYEILSEAIENYKKTDLFSSQEIEETFWKIQTLWDKEVEALDETIIKRELIDV
jgi:esterase/lipase